jgi:D-arabinose 1-dehydrogenase-like Zn-dependent alcohol dehydrogenase
MNITAAVVPVRSAPFEIETLDLAAPLADEVLVRVVASGMCHTDLHARDGYFPNLPYPVVCGHEGAGIIEQVGADVADLAPGDPVVISFPWCSECGPCRAERISYCERARPLKSSGRRADGSIPMSRNGEPVYSCFFQQSSFASFAVAPAKDVVKIRRDAPIEMLGPLGCGLQTGAGAVLNVMQPAAGQSIAVYGVGGVGLAGLMAARIAGCDPIIAVDRLPSRLALVDDHDAEIVGPTNPSSDRLRAPRCHEFPSRHRCKDSGSDPEPDPRLAGQEAGHNGQCESHAMVRSADCFPQNCLVRSASGAATRELAVYDHSRQASNPVLFCPRYDVRLMHVVNFDVVRRARNTLDQLHRLVTRRATGAENLNLSPLTLDHCFILLLGKPTLTSSGLQQAPRLAASVVSRPPAGLVDTEPNRRNRTRSNPRAWGAKTHRS